MASWKGGKKKRFDVSLSSGRYRVSTQCKASQWRATVTLSIFLSLALINTGPFVKTTL
jgi:hypothetical protein